MLIKIHAVFFLVLFVSIGYCEYHLVWSDEFNDNFLDTKKWNYEVDCWGGGNDEKECYVKNDPRTLYLQNGNLVISQVYYPEGYKGTAVGCTNDINPAACTWTQSFTSARIRTKYTQSWYYGKFEFRAKLPNGNFLWPAFWMLPTDNIYGTWAASGEIDIMEYKSQIPDQLYQNVWHSGVYPFVAKTGKDAIPFPVDFSSDYHIFEFEWTPENMTWLVDGDPTYFLDLNHSFWTNKDAPDPYHGAFRKPFDQRFHIIINVAVAGNFFGSDKENFDPAKDSLTWTSPLMVDYVRVYQDSDVPVPSPAPLPPPVPQPTLAPPSDQQEKPWHEPVIVVLIGVTGFEFLVIIGLIWSLRQRSQDDDSDDYDNSVKSTESARMLDDEYN